MLHGAKEITALTTTVNTGSNGVCGSSDHLLGQVKDRNVLRGQRNLLGGQVKDLRSLSLLPPCSKICLGLARQAYPGQLEKRSDLLRGLGSF